MAFSLTATVGGTTLNLNNGNPFRLESAEGLGSGGVIRHEQRGPLQDGASDLSYRLAPRAITLHLVFFAATNAALDAHRDTLMATFKPLPSYPLRLRVDRDDGEVRQLDCYAVDEVDVHLVSEDRAAHLHRAVVNLRAPSPLWQATDIAQGSVNYANWWLAGGGVDPVAELVAYAENPEVGGAGFSLGGAGLTGDWTVAFVTSYSGATSNVDGMFVWSDSSGSANLFRENNGGTTFTLAGTTGRQWPQWPGATVFAHAVVNSGANTFWWYTNAAGNANSVPGNAGDKSLGPNFRWGASYFGGSATFWDTPIHKGVIARDLSTSEARNLMGYMLGQEEVTVSIVNAGDVDAHPVIRLYGPMRGPVIANKTIGATVDLGGVDIPAGAVWTLDLRNGDKLLLDESGNNMLDGANTTPIGMAGFTIAAAPRASGGVNQLSLAPGLTAGSTSYMVAEITPQYMSF